jgi:MFS family permease
LLGWRWVFWIALIIAGAGVPFVLLVPETYLPVLIRKWKKDDAELGGGHHIRTEVPFEFGEIFIRPYAMLLTEPIVSFTSLYLSVIYGVLFLFFQAYPKIFEGTLLNSSTLNMEC